MAKPLYALGRFCVRQKWLVLGLWVVAVVALVITSFSAGSQASDNLSLPGTDSQKATDVLNQRFPSQANGTSPIVVSVDQGTLTSGDPKSAIEDAVSAAKKSDIVETVVDPFSSAGASAVSKDGKTAYISIGLKEQIGQYTNETVEQLVDDVEAPLNKASLDNAAGGVIGSKITVENTSSEAIGIAAAIVILLFTFGSAVSMALPILTAIFALAGALSGITLLSHVVTIPTVGPTLGTMLGLGVGIDYSLFLVSRHRQQLAEGIEPDESVARAVATTGGAIVFAGGTVVIAICSLALAHIPIVSAMGFTAAIAVVVAILAAITLLPALMAILGMRIDAWRIPGLHKLGAHPKDHGQTGWARWAGGVAKRPWLAIVAALLILIPLSIPTLSLQLGQADVAAGPPDAQATQAYNMLTAGFGEGINGPILISTELPGSSSDAATLQTLSTDIAKDKDVAAVAPPDVNDAKTAAILTVVPKSGPSDQATTDLVHELRDTTIPAALKGTKVVAYVGGSTAAYIDLAAQISDGLPRVIITVIVLSFLLLLVAFRSIAVSVQAAAMNLLGVAASYGVIVAVFQWGWLSGLVGLDGAVPIVSFVPLMMFAILFGLSMDYEVFLISHVQEEYVASGDNTEAVVRGLSASARVITSAALIMVFVFGSFVFNGDPTVKQFGLGLAFAIALDATVIRCLLVPALMVLMKKANWWIPTWLDRVMPHLSIEGGNFLVSQDASAQRAAAGERLEDLES